MTTTARDPWADAAMVATRKVLNADVAAVRRRLVVRRVGRAVLAMVLVICVVLTWGRWADLWFDGPYPVGSFWLGLCLAGLGLALVLVGQITPGRAGTGSPFITPDAFLTRQDRRWVRQTIAAGSAVAPERQEVVTDTARRLVRDATPIPHVGTILFLSGLTVLAPSSMTLLLFPVLAVWRGYDAIVEQVRARRARRWLARNA